MDQKRLDALERKLVKSVWNAVNDFSMIEEGDKLMVCLSGGKDSYSLLEILLHMQKASPFHFEIIAVNMDQKQPGFPEDVLPNYLTQKNVPFRIIERDTYSIVKEKTPEGKTYCSLCSRLRRGTLYSVAEEMGIKKIVLGHHREDMLETFFLNLLFSGKLESMPAKYRTDDGKFVVMRPLAYCKEEDLAEYSVLKQFPIIPCNLCGTQENMQRQNIKKLLNDWEQKYPGRKEVIFNALGNISPSHMFDHDIFDFKNLEPILGNKTVNDETYL